MKFEAKKIRVGDSKLNRSFLSQRGQSKPLFFQPRLTVGPADDVYEREADAVADKVMRMGDNEQIQTKISNVDLQRYTPSNQEVAQRKEGEHNKPVSDTGFEGYVNNLSSGGQPLPDEARNFYEPRFGYDFSNVRIHYDTVAAKSAQSINALAYTTANNIVFNNGQYSPDTDSGKKLVGHELTHVIQQQNIGSKIQRWDMDNAPIGDPERDVHIKKSKPIPKIDMPSIKVKRKDIKPFGDDKYGHWWTEINGTESYGWWPKYHVGVVETLFGTEGELNGQTTYGGTPTKDPHHGDSADQELDVQCTDTAKSEATAISEMRAFASAFTGGWRWTFGWGKNCHTFQEEMLSNSSLVTK